MSHEIAFAEIQVGDLLKVVQTETLKDFKCVRTWDNVKVNRVNASTFQNNDEDIFHHGVDIQFFLISRPVKVPELYGKVTSRAVFDALPENSVVKAAACFFDGTTIFVKKVKDEWIKLVNTLETSTYGTKVSSIVTNPSALVSNYQECILVHLGK